MGATKQLEWWRGRGGDDYTARHSRFDAEFIEARAATLHAILSPSGLQPQSILEVGCNAGANLRALREAAPPVRLLAVEPNARARALAIEGTPGADVRDYEISGRLPFDDGEAECVMTCGALIHVEPPVDLSNLMSEIVRVSSRLILLMEYFAPRPEQIEYQGARTGLLWRGDFGSAMLEVRPDLELMNYGFLWRRATAFDDLVWWLFQKPTG